MVCACVFAPQSSEGIRAEFGPVDSRGVVEEIDSWREIFACWSKSEGAGGAGGDGAEEAVVEIGTFENEMDEGVEGVPDEEEADFEGRCGPGEEGERGAVGC